jgi:hypothetical protein
VSDGGLKLGLGTAAFVIEGQGPEGRIRGVNQVPGPIKEGDLHRCEVSGLYAVILTVKEICQIHNIKEGDITICCNNTTTLEIFDPDYLPNPKRVNFNITSACWALKNTVPILWDTEHIKGHQDRVTPYHALSHKSKLNVEMDSTAKAYWIHLVSAAKTMPYPKIHEILGEEWQIWNGDQILSHPADNILYSCMQDPITDMWWTREGHVTAEATHMINYTATADTMHQLAPPRR